jgi:acetyl esterase
VPLPLDYQTKRVLEAAAAIGAPDYATLTPQEARDAHVQTLHQAGPAEEVHSVEDRSIPGPGGDLAVRIYRPAGGRLPGFVYFHGGGWVVGTLDTVDVPLRAIANRSGCAVVSVDYRLAPENKFPKPLEDARAAIQWVCDMGEGVGIDVTRVGVGGDSAGGNIAASAALSSRRTSSPACQVLIYPVLDFSFDTRSYEEFADGYGLTRRSMQWYWNQYLANPKDGADVMASPARAKDLSGLPPSLVITAEYDPLRDEGEAFAAKLRASGVDVRLSRYDGTVHGFFRMGAVIDAAHRLSDEVGGFLRDVLARTRVSDA